MTRIPKEVPDVRARNPSRCARPPSFSIRANAGTTVTAATRDIAKTAR